MTLPKSAPQPSHLRRMAAACSLPCQRVQSFDVSAIRSLPGTYVPYWTISGRIGDEKTAGSGWVEPLAEPSAEAIVTVGRVVILRIFATPEMLILKGNCCGDEVIPSSLASLAKLSVGAGKP